MHSSKVKYIVSSKVGTKCGIPNVFNGTSCTEESWEYVPNPRLISTVIKTFAHAASTTSTQNSEYLAKIKNVSTLDFGQHVLLCVGGS